MKNPTKMLSPQEIEQFKKTISPIDFSRIKPCRGASEGQIDTVGWSQLKDLVGFMRSFSEKHGRGPTVGEIDSKPQLQSSRQIQRKFGGVMYVRSLAGLEEDHRKTELRKEQILEINKRACRVETAFYRKLVEKFGERSVDRGFSFLDDTRHRTDFMVYTHPTDDSKRILIDVFYPGTRGSLGGCVGAKRRKYHPHMSGDMEKVDQIYFVNLNPALDADSYLFKKPAPWVKVVNETTFWKEIIV